MQLEAQQPGQNATSRSIFAPWVLDQNLIWQEGTLIAWKCETVGNCKWQFSMWNGTCKPPVCKIQMSDMHLLTPTCRWNFYLSFFRKIFNIAFWIKLLVTAFKWQAFKGNIRDKHLVQITVFNLSKTFFLLTILLCIHIFILLVYVYSYKVICRL